MGGILHNIINFNVMNTLQHKAVSYEQYNIQDFKGWSQRTVCLVSD